MSEAQARGPVTIERKGNVLLARPQIKMMDEAELKALEQAIDDAAGSDAGISLVVLDLSQVRILPSLTLGILVQMSGKCRARQQRLKLAALQPQVKQVFTISRLDRVLDLAPTVEAALE